MKKLTRIILLLILPLAVKSQNSIDVLHYRFELELNDINDTVYGQAEIRFTAATGVSHINLDLDGPSANGKGMEVIRVTYPDGFPVDKSYEGKYFPIKNGKVSIALETPSRNNDTNTIIINYKGIPSDGLIISKNKYGHRTFFGDNWPDRAHYWIPCNDRPDDKASFEFIVTAPAHYQVISNGVLVEETSLTDNKKLTHWREDTPLSTKIMVIGVADFAVNYAGTVNGCIPVSSWVYPENKEAGFYDYALARDILSFFIDYIGPYPYKKLANVQSKTIFGGMENAGAIFYHENSVVGHREEEMLYTHEIVHQWFGDMASEKNFSHLWLSEGFATYLTHIYTEQKYGIGRFTEGLKNDRQEVIDYLARTAKPIVDSITPRRQLINTNNYARAGWILHMLRRQLGDSVFHSSIRSYYETYKGKNAGTEDLEAIFEKESGRTLDTFFRQWLYTPEIPKLDISWKYNAEEKNISISISQLQQAQPFRFPLDVWVQGAGGPPKTVTLSVSKATETFIIPVKTRPLKVIFDPLTSLLYEGDIREIK